MANEYWIVTTYSARGLKTKRSECDSDGLGFGIETEMEKQTRDSRAGGHGRGVQVDFEDLFDCQQF
jgi:hypothetical protein